MAAAVRHGISITEFDGMRPWEIRELLDRLNKNEQEESKAKADYDTEVAKAVIESIGNVLKGLEGVTKRLDQVAKLIAQKPSM